MSPSSPFTVLLHCPDSAVSKEKSAVAPIFVPPWVVFLSASKVSSDFQQCAWYLDSSFACLFMVFNLLGARCVYYRLLVPRCPITRFHRGLKDVGIDMCLPSRSCTAEQVRHGNRSLQGI